MYMYKDKTIYEREDANGPGEPDPDEILIKDRRVYTQPYDLVVRSLIDQIKDGTIFLRPLSERPNFQRRYVWSNIHASPAYRVDAAQRPDSSLLLVTE